MNTLALRVRSTEPHGMEVVDVLIDGRDLRELVRAVELLQATADDQPDLAGSYEAIPLEEWPRPRAGERERVTVLGCSCGVTECWPLRVRITVRPGTVVWSDFQQPNRGWTYEGLGPFTFAREPYETAVAAVADHG